MNHKADLKAKMCHSGLCVWRGGGADEVVGFENNETFF